MSFHFEKRIRDRGRRGLIGTLLFALPFGAMDYYLLQQPVEIGQVVGTWFAGFLVLFVGLVTIWCLVLLCSKERWLIRVTDGEIIWEAPKNMDEHSFRLPIASVQKLVRRRSQSGRFATQYRLILRGGSAVAVPNNLSGMDMNGFIACLESHGVPYEKHDE